MTRYPPWDRMADLHICDDDGWGDGETQSTTACCPRQTIPDSCSCPDGCDCWCRDCRCGEDDEECE